MSLLGRIRDKVFGWLSPHEAIEAAQDGEIQIPANREYRRSMMRYMRLKGPGYTRSMRKGRTQRVRDLDA